MKTIELVLSKDIISKDYDASVRDYFSLLKPRVMSLVVFTGFCGMILAPGHIHPFIAAIAVFCIALGSGAAGAINMWYESDIDALMQRTRNRPIPAGRMCPETAIEFACVMAFASVFIMAVAVNLLSAFFLLNAILFYVFIYTIWLKRITPQNIVIGGAAGAFPPLIGWAAVTNSISIDAVILFAIIFLWTPPHFWALALYKSDDYAKAGIPMLPVVKGNEVTRRQILLYSVILVTTTFLPYYTGMSGKIYLAGVTILDIILLKLVWQINKVYSEQLAKKLFGFSILYLFSIFSLAVIDKVL